jgi:hypothetical protein
MLREGVRSEANIIKLRDMNSQYIAPRHNPPTCFDLNQTMTNTTLNSRDNTVMIEDVDHEIERRCGFAMEYDNPCSSVSEIGTWV